MTVTSGIIADRATSGSAATDTGAAAGMRPRPSAAGPWGTVLAAATSAHADVATSATATTDSPHGPRKVTRGCLA
jgi:hypothetical protein